MLNESHLMNPKSVEVKVLHVGCSFYCDITDEDMFWCGLGKYWANNYTITKNYTSQYIRYILVHTYIYTDIYMTKVKQSFYRPTVLQEF